MSFMNSSSSEIPFGLDRRGSSLREEVIAYIYQSGTFKLACLLSYHLVISLWVGSLWYFSEYNCSMDGSLKALF